MKLEKLVGDRFKERPADCTLDSHALMLRGGYMKAVTAGIYSQYLPLRRICLKIEAIIRQEMDAIDGQEVQFRCPPPSGKSPAGISQWAATCCGFPTGTAHPWCWA